MTLNGPGFYKQSTFYPAGTECYRDPSQASCFLFGNSGAGAMRKITAPNVAKEQFAFTGPLSMHKSCDKIAIFDNKITYSSENPGIFTDAYCYLQWLAEEYGLKLPDEHVWKVSCIRSRGNQRNIDQMTCYGQSVNISSNAFGTGIVTTGLTSQSPIRQCDFKYTSEDETFDRCKLLSQEGYAYNVYTCKVRDIIDYLTTCEILKLITQ